MKATARRLSVAPMMDWGYLFRESLARIGLQPIRKVYVALM